MNRRYFVCALAGALSLAHANAQNQPDAQNQPIAALDLFALEHPSDPQISADGSQIVYVRNFSDINTDERYSNLWIMNADGGNHRALTTGNIRATTPRWSPDGARLAYISNAHAGDDEDSKPQIYVRDMASGDVSMISNLDQAPAGIAWSPDGEQIAFTMLKPEDAPVVEALPAAPEGAEWKAPATVYDKLVYRFDGAGYLPHGYHHIYVIPSEGGTPRQISSGDYNHAGPGSRAGGLNWSADGREIILSAKRDGPEGVATVNTEVYAFRVRDGRVRQLTDRDGPDDAATISPDGRMLAYQGFDDRRQGFQVRELYVQRLDGGGRRSLTPDLDRGVHAIHWAPDSNGVYFAYDDEGVTHIAHVSLDGDMRDVVGHVSGGSYGFSVYGGAAEFSVADSGAVAAIRSFTTSPEDLWIGRAGEEFRQLTNLNDDLLSQRAIGEVETLWWESSKDGRRIQGWLVFPPDFDPSRKYPLFLEIHGGPFTNYGDRFGIEMQYLAARGYVVLYTNPRGSTSYGEEFGNLIHHAYPGDDFYDLMSGVDAAIARGFIDEDRLYVGGGSGGGVLSSWLIGRTDRFKAAVIYYPVIDWESFNLTTDIPWTITYWFPGVPWENRDHYWSRSLLSVVENVTTPALLITGEADHRTPISQTEQYYAALKRLGVETKMIRIPDEPHLTRVHPSHWLTRLVNTAGWLDQHQ